MSKLTLEMARNLVAKLEAEEKEKKVQLKELKPGETFMIGEHEFIVLEQIYGIGGRDTKSDDIEKVYNDLLEIVETGKIDNPYRHLGLRTKGAEK